MSSATFSNASCDLVFIIISTSCAICFAGIPKEKRDLPFSLIYRANSNGNPIEIDLGLGQN